MDLNLNENFLRELTPELSKCPKLKILRLQNNDLSINQIPEKILSDSKVKNYSMTSGLKSLECDQIWRNSPLWQKFEVIDKFLTVFSYLAKY